MKVNLHELLEHNGYTFGATKNIRKKNFKEKLAEIPREEIARAAAEVNTFYKLIARLGLIRDKGGVPISAFSPNDKKNVIAALDFYGIDYSHFKGRKKGASNRKKIDDGMTPDEVVDTFFLEKGQHNLSWRKVVEMIDTHELLPMTCSECGISPKWNGKPLKLQVDHINGDNGDHRIDNLRRICPNCHSQTDTYCSKNRKIPSMAEILSSKKV